MVRCIPTFVILGLIASLTYNHPIEIDNVDEIVETAGIQAVDEEVFPSPINNDDVEIVNVQTAEESIYTIAEPLEAVPASTSLVIVNEKPTDSVEVQAVDIEESTNLNDLEEIDTAGVQAVDEDIEEDVVAGIQGEEDVVAGIQGEEDVEEDVVVAEATPTASDDDVVAQAADQQNVDENVEMEFELFEEGEEGDDEMTAASVINEEINPVQNPSADAASVYENIALEALNRLKILHIFRSNKFSFRKNKRGSESESESDDEEPIVDKPEEGNFKSLFYIKENETPEVKTEVPVNEAPTSFPEEMQTEDVQDLEEQEQESKYLLQEAPTEVFEEVDLPRRKRCVDERCEEDDVEIALFEVEVETNKNDFETVTEMVTDVHVVSVDIDDDDDQPTIGAIALEPEADLEEEIPLFGVIEEIDDEEVQIAKKDTILFNINYEVVEVDESQTPAEETSESLVISGILIDLSQQEDQNETVTDVVDEEPTTI